MNIEPCFGRPISSHFIHTSDNEKNLLDNETMNTYNDFKYLVYLEKFFDATKE